jgi:hypothetical protein
MIYPQSEVSTASVNDSPKLDEVQQIAEEMRTIKADLDEANARAIERLEGVRIKLSKLPGKNAREASTLVQIMISQCRRMIG